MHVLRDLFRYVPFSFYVCHYYVLIAFSEVLCDRLSFSDHWLDVFFSPKPQECTTIRAAQVMIH